MCPRAQGFSIDINPLDEEGADGEGGEGGEGGERCAAAFSYDAVNQRVSVALSFAAAGVYRAALRYDGALLHNGEFDCIVLTREWRPATVRPRGGAD